MYIYVFLALADKKKCFLSISYFSR